MVDEGTSRIEGPIRVEGMLRLAPGTVCTGDVQAPGGLVLGEDAIVEGDVYTDGSVELGKRARIGGRILATSSLAGPSEERVAPSPRALVGRLWDLALDDRVPDPELVDQALAQIAEENLEVAPQGRWPGHLVRDVVFDQVLASLVSLDVEREDPHTFVLRIPETKAPRVTRAVIRLARWLGQGARPGTSLHPLSSPDTRGDTLLLVDP